MLMLFPCMEDMVILRVSAPDNMTATGNLYVF